jgi:hypothetical protein
MKSSWDKLHLVLKIGLIIFLIGCGPFFVVMGLDAIGIISAGNFALGTGPLVALSFYPSLILIIIGSILKNRERKNNKLLKNRNS